MANHIVTEVMMRKIFRQQEGVSNNWTQTERRLASRLLNMFLAISCLALLLQYQPGEERASALAASTVYLPFITQNRPVPKTPVIHMPFIDDNESYDVMTEHYSKLGVFWFGKVNGSENYSDVRVGYNRYTIVLDVATIDQQLWYDAHDPPSRDFKEWDSVSIFLTIPGANGQGSRQVRLDAEATSNKWSWEQRTAYQNAYQWNGGQWERIDLRFTTDSFYQGSFNEPGEDDGWNVTFRIPFSSLGLSAPPPSGSGLRMGIEVFDKDSASRVSPSKSWPEGFTELNDSSYGQITFGYPTFRRPANSVAGRVNIKQSSTETVQDSTVGGGTTCGNNGNNKWTEWGGRVYNNRPQNEVGVVQNQQLIADWPCFSRYYITFPLNRVPQGKVILSAKLTMIHYGGSSVSQAKPSYIQVMRVNQPWDPDTISWNNSPQAVENYPGTWVPPYDVQSSGSPGVARTWDVSQAFMDVYGTGEPLRLALYSADRDIHIGNYFRSSETASWGCGYPPTLTIEWGNP